MAGGEGGDFFTSRRSEPLHLSIPHARNFAVCLSISSMSGFPDSRKLILHEFAFEKNVSLSREHLRRNPMKNSFMFNDKPGGEWVQVPHISSLLGCSQHCRATSLKNFLSYANIQEAIKQTTGGQEFEDPTQNKV